MEKWTKRCQKCLNWIPDEHTLCNFHLREKYNLVGEAIIGADHRWRYSLYTEDVVLAALRAAEQSKRQLLEACKAALDALAWSQDDHRDWLIGYINDAQGVLEQAMVGMSRRIPRWVARPILLGWAIPLPGKIARSGMPLLSKIDRIDGPALNAKRPEI